MRFFIAKTAVFAALFAFCAFITVSVLWLYESSKNDDPVMIEQSLMVPTADGRTIECIVFTSGSVSCNWNPVVVTP